jgi:hypothetical protein
MSRALNWTGLRKEANQPVVLMIREFFPHIFYEVPRWRPEGLVGGYNPRSIGGGHEYGLAADIYVRVAMPNEKRIGDGLFELFMSHSYELGVAKVIWNGRTWEASSSSSEDREYRGSDPHTDHVHVRFTRAASQFRPPRLLFLMRELHDRTFGAFPQSPASP